MPAGSSRCVELLMLGTSASLVSFLIWGCFFGWGRLLARMLPSGCNVGPGMCAAIGMAFTAVAGGLPNLLGIISVSLLRGYLIAGILFALFFAYSARTKLKSGGVAVLAVYKRDGLLVVLTLIAVALLFVQFTAAGNQPFNSHDDYQGYLIFPVQMLQTGSLVSEAFNSRGITCIGGQSFLNALTLSLVPLTRIHVLEMGAAWLVLLGLMLEHAVEIGMELRKAVALVILLHLIQFPLSNVSSVITAVALLCMTLRILGTSDDDMTRGARLFLLALAVGAICSLKLNHIPFLVIMILMFFCFSRGMELRDRVKYPAVIAVAALAMISPWLVASYQSYGTFLYPFLGKGHVNSVLADPTWSSPRHWIADIIVPGLPLTLGSALFVGGVVVAFVARRHLLSSRRGQAGLLGFVGAWIVTLAMFVLTVADYRLTFAATLAATLVLLAESMTPPTRASGEYVHPGNQAFIGTAVLIFLLGANWTTGLVQAKQRLVRQAATGQEWSSAERGLKAMQTSLPEGAPILAHVSTPFLLDFRRNPTWVVDWPGLVGPPPGLPVLGIPEETVAYLRAQRIRYVAYSYADEAGFTYAEYMERLNYANAAWRFTAEFIFAFHKQLDEMCRTYEKAFDDGNVYVIDLEAKRLSTSPTP